jgi:hypothetical protein
LAFCQWRLAAAGAMVVNHAVFASPSRMPSPPRQHGSPTSTSPRAEQRVRRATEQHSGCKLSAHFGATLSLKVRFVSAAKVGITNRAADHQGHLLRSPCAIRCSLKCVVRDFVAEDFFMDRIDCFVVHDTKPMARSAQRPALKLEPRQQFR